MSEQDGGVAADEGQVTVAGKAKIVKVANIANIAKFFFELKCIDMSLDIVPPVF